MKTILQHSLVLSALVILLPACSQDSNTSTLEPVVTVEDTRPNILYILADDLAFSDLGVFGGEIATPNLDMLATRGMLLTDFYTGLACSPTRAMLMSGMNNHLSGLGVMAPSNRPEHQNQPGYLGYLNFQVATLADLLTDAGYNTYLAGKWHLGSEVETGPRARGFKRSFVSLDGAAHLGPWDWRGPQNARYRDGDELVEVGDDYYSTRVYTEKMIDYIAADHRDGKPFFGWLAYTAPHWPVQAPKASIARQRGNYDAGYEVLYHRRLARLKELGLVAAHLEPIPDTRFQPRWDELTEEQQAYEARTMEVYAAMVSDLDRYVGQLIDYLREIDEFDNTFIIFSSDNGAESGHTEARAAIVEQIGKAYDHSLDNLGAGNTYLMIGRNWASATEAPFYRHKASAYEGGIHVPAFVYYPPLVPAGTRSRGTSHVMDLLPTFLALARHPLPGTTYRGQEVLPVQGKNLLPLLQGEAEELRSDNELLGFELYGHRSVRQGDWKLVWDHAGPPEARRWYLFNLAEDPFEQHDLSTSNPEQYARMLANWETFAENNGVIY